jgi:hypothetical protein
MPAGTEYALLQTQLTIVFIWQVEVFVDYTWFSSESA